MPAINLIVNGSFETPAESPGSITPNPGGGTWTWGTTYSGIASNGSAFGNPNAPDGTQCGYLQTIGYCEQSVTFPIDGDYDFSYYICSRELGGSQTVETLIDGVVVDSYHTGTQAYELHTFTATGITAGTYPVKFRGTISAGDPTCFIDDITLFAPVTGEGAQISRFTNIVAATNTSVEMDVSRFTNIVAGTNTDIDVNVSRFTNIVAYNQRNTVNVSRFALIIAFNTRGLNRVGAIRHSRVGRK